MATALQKQLSAIAASSTHELDLKAQKSAHSKSLLFEPKIAATQSLETIYQICIRGFEDLCVLDPRFTQFRTSLFSDQSKAEDRARMTERENSDLDNVIDHFLWLVCARLLLQPAVQATEWLVRRFRIQDYNVESLVLTFLPYHETPLFPTMLSLLPKELPTPFRFLHPYVNTLSNLPRSAIVHAAATNQQFFTKMHQYVLKSSSAGYSGHALVSVWAAVSTQAIDRLLTSAQSGRKSVQNQNYEDVAVRILSILDQALSISGSQELTLGCYMIITVLVGKTRLGQNPLDALMVAISRSWTLGTYESGIACAALLAERRQLAPLPKLFVKNFFESESFEAHLRALSVIRPARRLLLGMADAISRQSIQLITISHVQFVRFIMKHRMLENQELGPLVQHMLSHRDQLVLEAEGDLGIHSQMLISELESAQAKLLAGEPPNDTTLDEQTGHTTERSSVLGDARITEGQRKVSNVSPDIMDRLKNVDLSAVASDVADESFFTSSHSGKLDQLLLAFESSVRFGRLEELLDQPFFAAASFSQSPSMMSFLVRVWITSQNADLRTNALKIFAERISALQTPSLDLQLAIPYGLVALGDSSKETRRAAANAFISLHDTFERAGWNKSKANVQRFWGVNKFYGLDNMQQESWLATKTAVRFISLCLLPNLEECMQDEGAIKKVFKNGLDASSSLSESTTEDQRMKSSTRAEVFQFICDHIRLTPLMSAKLNLLRLANTIEKVQSTSRTSFLLSCFKNWYSLSSEQVTALCRAEGITVEMLEYQHTATIQANDQNGLSSIMSIVKGEIARDRKLLRDACCQRLRTLWPQLKVKGAKGLVDELLMLASSTSKDSTSISIRKDVAAFLKDVHIDSTILSACIDASLEEIETLAASLTNKRRRINGPRSKDARDDAARPDLPLDKLTVILELMDGQPSEPNLELFSRLFQVLQVLQEHRTYSMRELGYLQTMVLDNLYATLLQLSSKSFPDLTTSAFRSDLLVECVKNANDSRARNAALLILSQVARHSPDSVIRSIIPIFTLMSNTTMTHSDDFSAHVVDQTIQVVVPLLARRLKEESTNLASATAEILLSFAAAFEHIPPHRRLRLFSLLSSSMGPEDSLYAIIITLVIRFPGNEGVVKFSTNLLCQASSTEILVTIQKYLSFVQDSFRPSTPLYNVLVKPDDDQEQKMKVSLNLLSSLTKILRDESLRHRLYREMEVGSHEDRNLLQSWLGKSLQEALGLFGLFKSGEMQSKLLTTCATVLEKILDLAPIGLLSLSVQSILTTADAPICRLALQALLRRVDSTTSIDESSKRAVLALMTRVTKLVQNTQHITLQQSAISCLDRLVEKFGKLDSSATRTVAEVLTDKNIISGESWLLRSVSFHALSSVVRTLQQDFIPFLQKSWEAAQSSLDDSIGESSTNAQLHDASFSFFIAVEETIPYMVSKDIFGQVLKIAYKSKVAPLENDSKTLCEDFLRLGATKVSASAVLGAVSTEWLSAIENGLPAIQVHIRLLRTAIDSYSKSVVNRNLRALFGLFLRMMDLRGDVVGNQTIANSISTLEQEVIDTFMSLVVKINDVAFRPYFLGLVEWAAESPRSVSAKVMRLITLFRFLNTFSETLKSIATGYFDHVLTISNNIVGGKFGGDVAGQTLKSCTLQALTSSFIHDQDDFWQAPSHFDTISEPLVSELTVQSLSRTNSEVIPAITELAAAAASNDHYKSLNSLIIRLCQSDKTHIRLAAVNCERSLTQRLGDDWLANLPEMLPFISELQEDDDEAVELETARWIKEIEGILGESLKSMLQ